MKRLKIKRETIRELSTAALSGVVAGVRTTDPWPRPPPPTDSCNCAPSPTNSCNGCTLVTF